MITFVVQEGNSWICKNMIDANRCTGKPIGEVISEACIFKGIVQGL
jgi:hypothetical protein